MKFFMELDRVSGCSGFEQAIQGYAIHVLSITYQRLPRSILAEVSARSNCIVTLVLRFSMGFVSPKGGLSSVPEPLPSKIVLTLKTSLQAINVEGLSLDKFLEHQVNNNGWTLEKGGKVN